ncbi:MAG: BrnA antitoxin family protein [Pseudomonadota bacterium]
MTDRKPSIAERKSALEFKLEILRQKREWDEWMIEREMIPKAWRKMEEIAPCSMPKKKLNLCLDQDVVKFYRGLGRGYQARINAILRTWMHARIAKVIEGHGDSDWDGKPL